MRDTLSDLLRAAINSALSEVHTCLPGRIEDYDHTTQKASVLPLLSRRLRTGEEEGRPVVSCVPVVFPRCGGASLTFPVKKGDGCLLVFSERSLDAWLDQGGVVAPDDPRRHDITDCIAIMGLYPFSEASPQDNNTDVLLKYNSANIRIQPSGAVSITAPAGLTINGNVTVTGTVTASGNVTGAGKSLATHVHAGVTSGSSTTAPPT